MNDLNLSLYQRKLHVSIEYCVPCDYSEYALAAARDLIKNYQHVIEQLTFKMGSKGVFEVKADDEVLFSKKATGRHPKPGEVLQAFKELVGDEIPIYPQ
jgi:selenoprotein W-related protein